MASYNWVANEIIVSTGTSAYTLTIPSTLLNITRAIIQCCSTGISPRSWYTFDGTTPAMQTGKQLIPGSASVYGTVVCFDGNELTHAKLAANAAGVAWHVDYYAY